MDTCIKQALESTTVVAHLDLAVGARGRSKEADYHAKPRETAEMGSKKANLTNFARDSKTETPIEGFWRTNGLSYLTILGN